MSGTLARLFCATGIEGSQTLSKVRVTPMVQLNDFNCHFDYQDPTKKRVITAEL